MSALDLDKIKEAADRIVERAKANRVGESHARPINWECACANCKSDRAIILDAAPDMVREIERLTAAPSGIGTLDLARIEGGNVGGSQDLEDIADLCAAVRGQAREIERLRGLAREGWTRARDQASAAGDEESEAYAIKVLRGFVDDHFASENEATPSAPPLDPEAEETRKAWEQCRDQASAANDSETEAVAVEMLKRWPAS